MMDPTALADLARTPDASSDAPRTPAEVGKQAEAMFARLLLKEIRSSMPQDGMLGGREARMWQDMMDETIAAEIAEGGHLGLADQITRQLGGTPEVPEHVHRPAGPPQANIHGITEGRLTSRFGHRSDPFHSRRTFHSGIDVGAPTGTPIRSMRAGRVTYAGKAGTYGQLVIVEHAEGLETRYAHASTLDVAVGDVVRRGERLGAVGSTGRSTGPHLHFEVRRDGRSVDPLPYVNHVVQDSAQTTAGADR